MLKYRKDILQEIGLKKDRVGTMCTAKI